MFFFLNLVTVSLPIHMNNQVLIKFLESPWIMLINTSWKHLAPGGGGRGGLKKLFYGEAPPRGPALCNFICRFDKINQINRSIIYFDTLRRGARKLVQNTNV